MKYSKYIVPLGLIFIVALGFGWMGRKSNVEKTVQPKPAATPQVSQTMKQEIPSGLFIEATSTRELPSEPQIVRARFVKVDLGQLIDSNGQALPVKEFTFNLFADVVYTGVLEKVEQTGDELTWYGYLKDIENGYFTMVYTSGVYMGHFGSPLGIFEAVFVDDNLYRVIEIDQTKFPGGEG